MRNPLRPLSFWLLVIASAGLGFSQDQVTRLQYAPAPVDNPLKGLVPYAGKRDSFPHSMEFNYIGFAQLMKGEDSFDWQPLEKLLDDIANRGHQAIFRIYLEYPGKKDVIPQFLVDRGLKVHKYLNTNTQPFPPQPVETPDYENPLLRRALQKFIAALGKKYDGDPRIGFITAGLLGTWGEWHTYPKEELFASKAVQAEVMDAYQAAFAKTRVLLRYPAGESTWGKASNTQRPFGYHDDSFAWATLHTGRKNDSWFYMTSLKEAGPQAVEKWRSQPIGGEIRPEAWGKVFDENPGDAQIQNFRECVEKTHVSWLMDTGMFKEKASPERLKRAEAEVRRMGYEFHVASVSVQQVRNASANVTLELENRGVAPFYYQWSAEFGLISGGKVVQTLPCLKDLTGLLPGDKPRRWQEHVAFRKGNARQVPKGKYVLALRVPNPLPKGIPVRFANATQDQHLAGWLSLVEIEIPE